MDTLFRTEKGIHATKDLCPAKLGMCGATSRSDLTQSMHSDQTISDRSLDGVLKYVLRKEEYEGVLGKDMHATTEQVKSLIMDFTRLIDDAASVTNTPKH